MKHSVTQIEATNGGPARRRGRADGRQSDREAPQPEVGNGRRVDVDGAPQEYPIAVHGAYATDVACDASRPEGVMSMGRSSSLPLWKTAPLRTSATRCGALTARHLFCAASISL